MLDVHCHQVDAELIVFLASILQTSDVASWHIGILLISLSVKRSLEELFISVFKIQDVNELMLSYIQVLLIEQCMVVRKSHLY